MEKGRNLVPSGVEPVDKLRGGLEPGKLYLVHGEGPSKSLFGYQFLIEGLKRSEQVALIINYSPEDAVRWFARLGYDCLEDIYSGRLVVLECAEENLNQIARMAELSPVLRELRWLIGDKNPERVVFEPIGRLVIGEQGSTSSRSREFAAWANTIGSTSLLIANGRSDDLVADLLPLVRESFRFELKQEGDVAIRYLFFDKTPEMPGHAIEADPSKGIFLVDRPSRQPVFGQSSLERELSLERERPAVLAIRSGAEAALVEPLAEPFEPTVRDDVPSGHDPFTELVTELLSHLESGPEPAGLHQDPGTPGYPVTPQLTEAVAESPSELDPTALLTDDAADEMEVSVAGNPPEEILERLEIPGMVENLLRPPAIVPAPGVDSGSIAQDELFPYEQQDSAPQAHVETNAGQQPRVRPDEFNVLAISSDAPSAERIIKSLSEFHVEEAGNGVSGLARLISFRPDLVVLDIDLKAVDGFEVLKHIRANLDVPIIALSSSRLRASDRIRAAELGADYYLTKPFSTRELRQKARQLIARYRRIDEWITAPSADGPSQSPGRRASDAADASESQGPDIHVRAGALLDKQVPRRQTSLDSTLDIASLRSGPVKPGQDLATDRPTLLLYSEFVRRIEQMVDATIDGDAWFSVVGCRVNQNSDSPSTGRKAALAQTVPELIRNCDVASINESGDLMILLTDADQTGAKAFTARLQETVQHKLKTDPVIWVRTFPFSNQPDE